MKQSPPARPDRTYDVRTKINLTGQQGLVIEQGKRQAASGKKVRLMDIAADWLEERAKEQVDQKLKG